MLRPTGAIAAATLFFFLNLNPHHGRTLKEHARDFDFVGLFLIMVGVVLLLIGFNQSETSCTLLHHTLVFIGILTYQFRVFR